MITNQIEVEAAILQHLKEQGPGTIEELIHSLSHFTLNQVFFTLDRLGREGKLSIRHRLGMPISSQQQVLTPATRAAS